MSAMRCLLEGRNDSCQDTGSIGRPKVQPWPGFGDVHERWTHSTIFIERANLTIRQHMAAVGRRLQLLRAHGLIAKVPKTHRYVVTEKGRNIITALLTARQASTEELTALAA